MLEINQIYCGDCLDLMKEMDDNSVDLVFTSPPYNIGKNRINGGFRKKQYNNYCDDLNNNDYFNLTKKWINELLRISKYHLFWNIQESSNNRGIYAFIENMYNDKIKERFIWAKPNPPSSISNTCCASGWEYIYCLSNDTPGKRSFSYCDFSNKAGDYAKNIIIHSVNCENHGHNYAFGEWMPKHFINYFSKKDAVVFDPFLGSGTTAIACINTGRNFIGIEKDPDYFKIASDRIKKAKEQDRLSSWV